MENPNTWGKAEHVIADAILSAKRDAETGMVGLSAVRRIADALREHKLLKED